MQSILITDCLQNDFVGPVGRFDGLPNALHVGHDESLRLLGTNPAEGPVARTIAWAHAQDDAGLKVVHVRDWHDPADPEQREHLEQFGPHCLRDTLGAQFVFATDNATSGKQLAIIGATTLSNFVGAGLAPVLEPYRGQAIRVGLMGVWTEAKITFLAYDLRIRFPHFQLAVCSALSASSSRANHFIALDQMERILGVKVIPSVGEFIEYLGGSGEDAPLIGFNQKHPEVRFLDATKLADTDCLLLRYLFRGCRSVAARTLDGGFSGNAILGTHSVDQLGHEQVSHVVKIGPRALIGRERTAFERIEAVLGNSAPRVADFADFGDRGAIKYRYATMGGGNSRSFQSLYEAGLDDAEVKTVLDSVFVEQLGRFYRAAELERCNLLEYYDFKPDWEASVAGKVNDILGAAMGSRAGMPVDAAHVDFPNGRRLPHLGAFYRRVGSLMPHFERPHYLAYVHGDLNGANIIIDGQRNVWLIDFFHTHRGHVLKDLIKFESDLLYIFTKIDGEDALLQAMSLSERLIAVNDLGRPLADAEAGELSNPSIARAYRQVQLLRSYYPGLVKADRDPEQWLIGHLRYAVHTLGFAESNLWQKRWALYTASLAAEALTRRVSHAGPLRIDWLPATHSAPGRLGITMAPGRRDYGRSLEDDLQVLVGAKVDAVVCLLSPDEFARYGVDDLLRRYRDLGLQVYHQPIADGRTPSVEQLDRLLAWVAQQLAAGLSVLVHCVGGLGRAGTICACYLRTKGIAAPEAIAIVRQARSPRAVETTVQEQLIKDFVPSLRV